MIVDNDNADAEPIDEDAAEIAEFDREYAKRAANPVLRRRRPVPLGDGQPGWWVGHDRASFAVKAAARAEELRTCPLAAKVKPLMNFVGGMP